MIFLVYFPLGILVPALRPWAALMSIGFHLGIALLMNLTGFALTMVACDLVFLSGGLSEALDRGTVLVGRLRSRFGTSKTTAATSEPASPLVPEKVSQPYRTSWPLEAGGTCATAHRSGPRKRNHGRAPF